MDTAARRDDDALCPCGRGGSFGALTFARCCGRWTGPGAPPAPDAESLMRSRYSAYVRGDVAHVSATWDPLTRPAGLDLDGGPTWLGLQVLDAGDDGVEQGRAVAHVEFVATYRGSDGRVHRMHERSRFTRRGERWFYVDGEVT